MVLIFGRMMKKMKEYKTVKEVIEKEKLIKAKCDFCQEEFDEITVECEGFGDITIEFGYGSKYDGIKYSGEICDNCFKEHFKKKLRIYSFSYVDPAERELNKFNGRSLFP